MVKARVAAGLTERQLAARLGVEEAEVLRVEASNYADACLGFLRDVARTLGVELHGESTIPGARAAD